MLVPMHVNLLIQKTTTDDDDVEFQGNIIFYFYLLCYVGC